jgi:hypothetical protein
MLQNLVFIPNFFLCHVPIPAAIIGWGCHPLCEHFIVKENTGPCRYLIDRGLTPGFIKQKLLGFIPPDSSFSRLPNNLKQSKFIKEKKLPSCLAGRIILPFWQGNQVVYLTGRTLDKSQVLKYLNITGQKTWTGNMRGPELIVTEGIFDQLLAEQAGFNCIATAGAGGKIKIHKGIKKILLCFDGDDQGREYIEKYALDFYVPLCIDELTSKNMRNFQGLIYAISGGVSRGKASKNDPLDIVELRNFSTLVFSNGEPPMLSQNSFAGETVRVWELTGPPFGVDDQNLINEIVSTIMENFGHAIEPFVLNYLNLADEFKNPDSFLPPEKINRLSNAERRILKQLDVIYFTGLIINEIFKFDFPVTEDMEYIFKSIGKQIGEKVLNIDNILSEIADYVSINHAGFPVVGKILKKNTIEGTVSSHQKIFGFLFPNANDGHDLGIIKSHFIDWMNPMAWGTYEPLF